MKIWKKERHMKNLNGYETPRTARVRGVYRGCTAKFELFTPGRSYEKLGDRKTYRRT